MKENRSAFRCGGKLDGVCPPSRKKAGGLYPLNGYLRIKDAIESQGAPHVEIDLIVVNRLDSVIDFAMVIMRPYIPKESGVAVRAEASARRPIPAVRCGTDEASFIQT